MNRSYEATLVLENGVEIAITLSAAVGTDLVGLIRSYYPESELIALNELTTPACPACEQEQPNQAAHMEPGGCMYVAE